MFAQVQIGKQKADLGEKQVPLKSIMYLHQNYGQSLGGHGQFPPFVNSINNSCPQHMSCGPFPQLIDRFTQLETPAT